MSAPRAGHLFETHEPCRGVDGDSQPISGGHTEIPFMRVGQLPPGCRIFGRECDRGSAPGGAKSAVSRRADEYLVDVQQQKVARAEALAFVAPVHFLSFPAILKGWLDRVWTPGFAYDLTPDAWRGDINGRQPKLTHAKALIIQTTIFDKRAYDAGLREAMRMVIDEFTLTYPGIKTVEHEYFYAMHGADDATRRGYLERAYALGLQF